MMEYVFSVLILIICIFIIINDFYSKNGVGFQLSMASFFIIGFYVLPVLFKNMSGLDYYSSLELTPILFLNFIFFICFVFGNFICNIFFSKKEYMAVKFDFIDDFFLKFYSLFFWGGFCVWIMFFFMTPTTSYGADDFNSFFQERSAFLGIIGFLSGFGVSAMALALVISVNKKGFYKSILMSVAFLSVILLLMTMGQRLAVITPVFTLVAAFAVLGYKRDAYKFIFIGVCFLVLISPIMVYLREFDAVGGAEKASGAAFSILQSKGSNVFGNFLQSIINRADLIENNIYLKDYIDSSFFDSMQYAKSVIFSFVPRLMLADKPYPLSDDGTMWGEISILAWRLMHGNDIGSLTAFGAITAYREGGWFWVPINGFLSGAGLAYIYRAFGRGGYFAKLFYCSIFVTLCIKSVPISFCELLVSVSPYVSSVLAVFVLNVISKSFFCNNKKQDIGWVKK